MPLTPEEVEASLFVLENKQRSLETTLRRNYLVWGGLRAGIATGFDTESALFPPIVYASHNGAGTVGTGAWGAMLLNTETVDTTEMHDLTTATSRLTARISGWYDIEGYVPFDGSATGQRGIRVRKNGATTMNAITDGGRSTGNEMVIRAYVNLAVGDYVEIEIFQDTGGDLGVLAGRYAAAVWRAPL